MEFGSLSVDVVETVVVLLSDKIDVSFATSGEFDEVWVIAFSVVDNWVVDWIKLFAVGFSEYKGVVEGFCVLLIWTVIGLCGETEEEETSLGVIVVELWGFTVKSE